jgi:hypothetical protein
MKGHWKGTWSLVKGTGEHGGIKGGETWDRYSLGPKGPFLEIEGELEISSKYFLN